MTNLIILNYGPMDGRIVPPTPTNELYFPVRQSGAFASGGGPQVIVHKYQWGGPSSPMHYDYMGEVDAPELIASYLKYIGLGGGEISGTA